MAAYTDAAQVRLRFLMTDEVAVPGELIAARIDDAHAVVLAEIDPAFAAMDPPPEALMVGETLLAGARVLRSLAMRAAQRQGTQRLGTQTDDTRTRMQALFDAARLAEKEGWLVLAPYLVPRGRVRPLRAAATTPVLGRGTAR